MTTVHSAVTALARSFREAGLPTPELDARVLVLYACETSHEDYILAPERRLSLEEMDQIATLQERRLAREPVSRIIGYREFWGRRFALGPATLDPRPDTETLIEAALGLIREEERADMPLRVLDLGTGTGCILLTLLAELPQAWGIGVDRKEAALHLASRNARDLGLASRAAFACGDWLDPIHGAFHLIVSNPPYIRSSDIPTLEPEVSRHDPALALDGGMDGLDAYRRIVEGAAKAAFPGSWVLVEAGEGQITGIVTLFEQAGWTAAPGHCRIYSDLAGVDRVVAIKRQAA